MRSCVGHITSLTGRMFPSPSLCCPRLATCDWPREEWLWPRASIQRLCQQLWPLKTTLSLNVNYFIFSWEKEVKIFSYVVSWEHKENVRLRSSFKYKEPRSGGWEQINVSSQDDTRIIIFLAKILFRENFVWYQQQFIKSYVLRFWKSY